VARQCTNRRQIPKRIARRKTPRVCTTKDTPRPGSPRGKDRRRPSKPERTTRTRYLPTTARTDSGRIPNLTGRVNAVTNRANVFSVTEQRIEQRVRSSQCGRHRQSRVCDKTTIAMPARFDEIPKVQRRLEEHHIQPDFAKCFTLVSVFLLLPSAH